MVLEINQATNEQIEQNQTEHQRSGEELEGNSTIDNEGERKQIEGKDDATDFSEDESSQLDSDDSKENENGQEQPAENEATSPEQQKLDNQDTIEGDASSANEMSENNQEITDSLDGEDSIEDEDLSETDDSEDDEETAENLDQEDSIEGDDSIDGSDTEEDTEDSEGSLDSDDIIVDEEDTEADSENTEDTEADGENVEDTEADSENAEDTETDSENAEDTEAEINDAEEGESAAEVEKSPSEIQEGINDYYSACNEIGKNPDMTPAEKVDAMQEKFESLGDGNRGDAQCIASEKYLNAEEPFRDNGRANVDYPDHQGFNMEEGKGPEAISRDNPMQDSVDRYGASGGNFVAGMENGEPASFESRALPNIENPDSYHSYDVDNGRYCDAVDMVRNCDPDNMGETIDNINGMIDSINEEQGLDLDHIDSGDMKDMIAHYNDYQKNLANDIPEIPAEDAPYGLSGEATPWDTASGERLSDGGADQKWLPLTVDDFEKMGIFKEK